MWNLFNKLFQFPSNYMDLLISFNVITIWFKQQVSSKFLKWVYFKLLFQQLFLQLLRTKKQTTVQQTVSLNFKDVLIKGGTLEGFKEQLNLPENPQYTGMAITAT